MQRWFFADEYESCDAVQAIPAPESSSSLKLNEPPATLYCEWKFCVLLHGELHGNEKLAVTGNTEALGNWKLQDCIHMTKEEDSNMWYASVRIPRTLPVKYRYLVIAVDPSNESVIVRRWETHIKPRVVPELPDNDCGDTEKKCGDGASTDVFGHHDGITKIDRGWLTSETLVQFKFFNAPFTWKQRMKRRLMYVKVTPMNLRIPTNTCDMTHAVSNNYGNNVACPGEDSCSNDLESRDNGVDLSTAFAFNEVVTLSAEDSELHVQPQFGTPCDQDDMVIFHLSIGDFESTAYLIDLYAYSSKAAIDEPPYHVGYHYVLPNLLKRSEGNLEVPITCASRHRPMGMMQLGYLIVRPLTSDVKQDMEKSYTRYWNPKWTGLDVGHRGSGTSFKATDTVIRENTIASLKNAAEHGADMVEFDVQLSKDLVPVVYHDFQVYVLLKAKGAQQEHDYLALPMRELTLEQLRNLKVYHTAEGRSRESRCFHNNDLLEHQPFPQLVEVLDAINPHVGFNIEIKWSQKLQDGSMEEEFEHVVDRNLYVDCILDVVLRYAGNRRIVFSCFDPDICTMLRYKQNRYPVMYLTLGVTERYKKYKDPRCHTVQSAVFHALSMELLGIVAHTEDLLRDPSQVSLTKNRGLVIFCWGDDNNSKETIKLLKSLGLHAIIYDKMDVLTSKEVKQSVFMLQAKESQKELLKLQALEMGKMWQGGTQEVSAKE